MGKDPKLGSGIIKREAVDTALSNLNSKWRKAEETLKRNINTAWGTYTDAVNTASKAQKEADKTAKNTLKQEIDQIDVAHQRAVGAGKGNYEATEQKREGARDKYKRELERNQETFDSSAQAAAAEFRRQSGEFNEDFSTEVNDLVQNYLSSSP